MSLVSSGSIAAASVGQLNGARMGGRIANGTSYAACGGMALWAGTADIGTEVRAYAAEKGATF